MAARFQPYCYTTLPISLTSLSIRSRTTWLIRVMICALGEAKNGAMPSMVVDKENPM